VNVGSESELFLGDATRLAGTSQVRPEYRKAVLHAQDYPPATTTVPQTIVLNDRNAE
jgi:hypothetical protein